MAFRPRRIKDGAGPETDKRMTVWGIGPNLIVVSFLFLVLAFAAHYIWYPLFIIRAIPYGVLIVTGMILIVVGVTLWIAAAIEVDQALAVGELATQGVYALCRHPIYGAAVCFVAPGILLLFRSWILLTVPLIMYVSARLLLRREEAYLRQEFGQAYLDYSHSVGLIFPRIWRLGNAMWYPVVTGQVAPHLYAARVRDGNTFFYVEGEHVVAFDSTHDAVALVKEMKRLSVSPESVTHVFLTHTDVDHAGGLPAFPSAEIYLSGNEEQMIDGTTARLAGLYHSPALGRPHHALDDGDTVTIGPIRIRAMATPGHTPGSMSYLVNGSVLFTGDALLLRNGRVRPMYRFFNRDTAAAKESIRHLASLEGVSLLCTAHTGCTMDFSGATLGWRR